MKQKDDLFELIKSMSKAEKRHFKLSNGTFGGGKNYLRLYEAIEEQEDYNEKEIRKKFANETFIRQLHVTKNYLYKLVIKSLKSFHEQNTSRHVIRTMLEDYELLYEKKLFRQAEKLLRRIKKLAQENENFYYLLEAFDKEEQMLRVMNDIKKLSSDVKLLYEGRDEALKKIKNSFTYKKISIEMMVLSHNAGLSREKETLEGYKKIINLPAMKDSSLTKTETAKGFFHQILSSCYYYTHDYKKSYYHLLQQKKFIEETPERKRKYIGEYLAVLGNMLSIGSRILDFEKMKELLQSFRSILDDLSVDPARILQPYYIYSVDVYSRRGNFSELFPIIKEAEKWVSETKIPRKADNYDIVLNQKIAYGYFGQGKYKEALAWLNKALNFPEKENIKIDIYPFLMIFNLILHYELNNTDLLPYITRSTFRYLSRKEKMYRFEKIILGFIRRTALTFKNKEAQREAFKKLKQELMPLCNDDFEKRAFDNFDFIAWLDTRIEDISFAEAIKKRAKK